MTEQLAVRGADAAIMERVILAGDLAKLQPGERVAFYGAVCRSVGLNPLTRPLEYLQLNGKLTLYATKACGDQLRKLHHVSIELGPARIDAELGMIERTAKATTPDGRTDEDVGVCVLPKGGDARANAIMKCATKAKRRVTLSICGLSLIDESELDTVREAKRVTVTESGEITDAIDVTPEAPSASDISAMVKVPWKKSEDYDKPLGALPRQRLHSMAAFVKKVIADPKTNYYRRKQSETLLGHIEAVIEMGRAAEAAGDGMAEAIAGREAEPWGHAEDAVGEDGDASWVSGQPEAPPAEEPPYAFRTGPFKGKTVRDLDGEQLAALADGPSALKPETLHAVREEIVRRGLTESA